MANQGLPQVMVQGLPSSADETFLEQLFGEVRPVHHPNGVVVKRKTDRRGQPVTYAFVTFETRQDVEHVINELNYTKLDGLPIRIIHADPETRNIVRSGKGNLFVKNLDPTIEDSQLHEAFGNFGEIVSCKIATDEKRESRGYGYVQFKREEDALHAMNDLKDASINGRPLTIQPFRRRQRLPEEEVFTNVYIKNLPASISTDDDLVALFRPYGEITSAKLQVRQGQDGQGLYFGFCNFQEHKDAQAAIADLNGKNIGGKVVECVRFKTRDERYREIQIQSEKWKQANYERFKDRNLYVRGFDESFTEDSLRQFFQDFGEIESVKIERDETGQSRKFGYVCFKNVEDAQKCLTQSPLLRFPESNKQVYVAVAIPAARKKQMNLQNKSQQAGGGRGQGGAEVRAPLPPVGVIGGGVGVPGIPGFGGRGGGGEMLLQGFAGGIPPGAFQPGIAGLGIPPGAFHGMPADPLPGAVFMPPANPKDRVRQEIIEITQGNQPLQNQLLTRLKEMSEDQALRLTRDQNLLVQWMRP